MGKPKSQKSKAKSNLSSFPKTLQSPSMANNFVMEERNELMVSPTGGDEYFRTAHFLAPSVASTDQSPDSSSFASAADSAAKYKDLPLKVNFRGRRYQQQNWKTWVNQMNSLHHSTWKKAGIFEAIMSSTYIIQRNDDLIFAFAEKWCPITNSFVFPWGEATITLEDVMILGGYSVLGEFVLSSDENGEMEEIVKKLLKARSDISRTNAKNANQTKWMAKFMGSQGDIEHEAFLAFWLSRFVFPFTHYTIGRSILPIAARLARGIKVALAPAILAGLYKNLTLLRAAIMTARKSGTIDGHNSVTEVTTTTPLALLQAWIWERFPPLRPNPNSIEEKEPRLARWHNVNKSRVGEILQKINSAAENFHWRPYVTCRSSVFHRKIYKDNEYGALVGPNLDEDLEALVRCLRRSDLVGLEANCIQHYLPHRVAMQFGFDQDIPGQVARVDLNSEIAWSYYCRPVRDTKLYVPPRVILPRVTTRYLDWWRRVNVEVKKDLFGNPLSSTANDGAEVVLSEKGSSKCLKRRSISEINGSVSPPPGFAPKGPKHCLKRKYEFGVGIKEMGADVSSSGSCRNNQLQECGRNIKVNPSSVESSTDELLLEMEDRFRNIEKLCDWIKAGNLAYLREIGKQLYRK